MQNPITKKSEKGFTLIELMIVVAIIGILASIAIPKYNDYRDSAFNAAAQAEMKNVQTALEGQYYAKDLSYPTEANVTDALAFSPSDSVHIYYGDKGGQQKYEACTYHEGGTKYFAVQDNSTSVQAFDCQNDPCTQCETPSGTGSDSMTELD